MKSTAKFTDSENVLVDRGPSGNRPSHFTTYTTRFYAHFGKRALDLLLIVIALPVVLPVVVIIGLLVRSDGHSALFLQERVGKGGTRFRVVKFRTMVPDAETVLESYLGENPEAQRNGTPIRSFGTTRELPLLDGSSERVRSTNCHSCGTSQSAT